MATCNYVRDCLKVPIPSRCVEYCLENFLRTTTLEEKQLILGLDANLAKAISTAYSISFINSFDDLRRILTTEQVDLLLDKFRQINQFQINYIIRSRDERDIIINSLRNMRLDMDEDTAFV